jgi:hypothetical protein
METSFDRFQDYDGLISETEPQIRPSIHLGRLSLRGLSLERMPDPDDYIDVYAEIADIVVLDNDML